MPRLWKAGLYLERRLREEHGEGGGRLRAALAVKLSFSQSALAVAELLVDAGSASVRGPPRAQLLQLRHASLRLSERGLEDPEPTIQAAIDMNRGKLTGLGACLELAEHRPTKVRELCVQKYRAVVHTSGREGRGRARDSVGFLLLLLPKYQPAWL